MEVAGKPKGRGRSRKTTQADVAERVGVTQSTVSKALQEDPRVPGPLRNRIREIAGEMDYGIVTTHSHKFSHREITLLIAANACKEMCWKVIQVLFDRARVQNMNLRIGDGRQLRSVVADRTLHALVYMGDEVPQHIGLSVIDMLKMCKCPFVHVSSQVARELADAPSISDYIWTSLFPRNARNAHPYIGHHKVDMTEK